jgi:16S rRNA (cytidine1402-2'-O)-methyltransferase
VVQALTGLSFEQREPWGRVLPYNASGSARPIQLMPMDETPGRLYVVATPLGNLEDLTPRAARTLREVALIACEDTRRTATLLRAHGIGTPTTSYFEHNERQKGERLLAELARGRDVALVTDAGTPGISDPGFRLVRDAHAAGIAVLPIPGPSAAVTALSVSGLPCERFLFVGFLPARASARKRAIEE